MSDGLPDLVSHVRLDTTGVAAGVARTKAELGGLGGATKGLEGQFKGLVSAIPGGSTFSSMATAGKSALSGIASEGLNLKSVMTGVGAGVAGVGIAVAGLALEGLSKFTAAAGEVRKLQATLGSTAEDASKLRNVAIGLGVDVDTMGKALFKLGPILEKNKGDFAGVHVEIAKNTDGSTNLIGTLGNMRVAYQGITDPLQRSVFLQEAFKKTGLDLRPILSTNNELFAKLAANGPIFKQADLDNAKALGLAQRGLKQAIDDAEISLAKGLVPTITKYTDLASGAIQKTQDFSDKLARIKAGGGPAGETVNLLGKAFRFVQERATPLGTVMDFVNSGQGKAKGSAEALKAAEEKVATQLEQTAKDADAAARAFDRLVTAQESDLDASIAMDRALLASTRSAEGIKDAELSLAQAHQTVAEKQAALTKLRQDGTATASEVKSAELDLQSAQLAEQKATEGVTDAHNSQRDALITAAKAVRDKKVADEEATGQTVTAEEKVRLFITVLRDQAGTLAPGSELRTNLEGYADKLENGIPHEVRTLVIADTAAANDGLDGIRAKIRALDGSSATITTFHNDVAVSHDDLSHAVGDGSAAGNILGPRGIIPLARGGTRTAGFVTNGPEFLVGEGNPAFPEVVIPTDPQFHDRARKLARYALSQIKGLAAGGVAEEDDPGWDWRTQGNGMHGVQDDFGRWFLEDASGRIYQHPTMGTPGTRYNDPNIGDGSYGPQATAPNTSRTRILSISSPRAVGPAPTISAPTIGSGSSSSSHQSFGTSSGGTFSYDLFGKAVAQAIVDAGIGVAMDGHEVGVVLAVASNGYR